ncbi:hypothetical protein COM69_15145 [Bacillus toyonensis]|nr:hypothetical protein COM69_15145 [Bacillus toyonensis]PHD44985.1 hypothetical protein COF65_05870 [Bacillus toyonensis]
MFYESMHFFIHSYPGAVLGFSFVTGLAKKLYKISHTLSLFFLWNAVDTFLMHKKRHPKVPSDLNHFNFNNMYWTPIRILFYHVK